MGVPTITVEAAFGSAPGAASPVWKTIHQGVAPEKGFVRSIAYQRGRLNELNRVEAGIGTLLLADEKSDFDSNNAAGRWYPDVKPIAPIRATALLDGVTYNLFRHFVDRLPRRLRVSDVYTERELSTVDGFELLAAAGVAGLTYAAELSGTRVTNVLNDASWATTARSIDVGQATIAGITFAADDETKALEHLLGVMESENGLFYIDGAGSAVFIQRHSLIKSPYTVSQVTFRDEQSGGGGYPYVAIEPYYGKDLVYNDWRGTRAGGVTQVSSDSGSQTSYFKRTQQLTSLVTTDEDVRSQIQWKLRQFKNPLNRIESISVMPGDDSAFWASVLRLDVGKRITIKEKPPGFSAVQTTDYIIQNLRAEFPPGPVNQARFMFGLWPADTNAWAVLDDASVGVLDTGTLAY